MLALDDALIESERLDAAVPVGSRCVDPRLLQQTDIWWHHRRRRVVLKDLSPDEACGLLAALRRQARLLHDAAVVDEEHTTSTAARWAMRQAGVPAVADLDPLVWLEATPLVRWLTGRADCGPGCPPGAGR